MSLGFPISTMDGFYKDPMGIREYALTLPFFTDVAGLWPGKRTMCLSNFNPELHDKISKRFFSIYFDFNFMNAEWNLYTGFQLIDEYSNDKDSVLNKSWIHRDADCLLAGIIYLNPEPYPDAGTTFYDLKSGYEPDDNLYIRRELHITGNVTSMDAYTRKMEEHSNMFTESAIVKNKFNRLVAYDANIYHGASTHFNNGVPRLTQTFFVSRLISESHPPIHRINSYK